MVQTENQERKQRRKQLGLIGSRKNFLFGMDSDRKQESTEEGKTERRKKRSEQREAGTDNSTKKWNKDKNNMENKGGNERS